jgi:hypothetical protein
METQHLRAPLAQSLFIRSPCGSADADVIGANEPSKVKHTSENSAKRVMKSFLEDL